MQIEAYCVKCRKKRVATDAKSITMKNGRPAAKGTCPKCGMALEAQIPDYEVEDDDELQDMSRRFRIGLCSRRRRASEVDDFVLFVRRSVSR